MDMHSHLLWGVDDGARTQAESLELISLLKKRGFRGACCTPHVISRYPWNTATSLKVRFRELVNAVPDGDFELRLAAEYMLDDHFERQFTEEEPLSPDGTHILVELPQYRLPDTWMDMLLLIKDRGYVPVLAHPERYGKILTPEELAALATQGILFQGNIGSLCGFYGQKCRELARKFQQENLYFWWGTDAHNAVMINKLRL